MNEFLSEVVNLSITRLLLKIGVANRGGAEIFTFGNSYAISSSHRNIDDVRRIGGDSGRGEDDTEGGDVEKSGDAGGDEDNSEGGDGDDRVDGDGGGEGGNGGCRDTDDAFVETL